MRRGRSAKTKYVPVSRTPQPKFEPEDQADLTLSTKDSSFSFSKKGSGKVPDLDLNFGDQRSNSFKSSPREGYEFALETEHSQPSSTRTSKKKHDFKKCRTPSYSKQNIIHKKSTSRGEATVTESIARSIEGMIAKKRSLPVLSARLTDRLLSRLENVFKHSRAKSNHLDGSEAGATEELSRKFFAGFKQKPLLPPVSSGKRFVDRLLESAVKSGFLTHKDLSKLNTNLAVEVMLGRKKAAPTEEAKTRPEASGPKASTNDVVSLGASGRAKSYALTAEPRDISEVQSSTKGKLGIVGLENSRLMEFAVPMLEKFVRVQTTKPLGLEFKATIQEFKTRYFSGLKRKPVQPPVNSGRIWRLLEATEEVQTPKFPSITSPKFPTVTSPTFEGATKDVQEATTLVIEDFKRKIVAGLHRKNLPPPVTSGRIHMLLERVEIPTAKKPSPASNKSVPQTAKKPEPPQPAKVLLPKKPEPKAEPVKKPASQSLSVGRQGTAEIQEFQKKLIDGLKKKAAVPVTSSRIELLLERFEESKRPTPIEERKKSINQSKSVGRRPDPDLKATIETFAKRIINGLPNKAQVPKVNAGRIWLLLEVKPESKAEVKAEVKPKPSVASKLEPSVKIQVSRKQPVESQAPEPTSSSKEIPTPKFLGSSSEDTSVETLQRKFIQGIKAKMVKPVKSVNKAKINALLKAGTGSDPNSRAKFVTHEVDESLMLTVFFAKKVLSGIPKQPPKVPVKSSRIVHLLQRNGGNFPPSHKALEASSESLQELFAKKVFSGLAGKKKPVPVKSSRIKELLKVKAPEPQAKDRTIVSKAGGIELKIIQGLIAKPVKPVSSARYMQIALRNGLVKRPQKELVEVDDTRVLMKSLKHFVRGRKDNSLRAMSERLQLEKIREVEFENFQKKQILGLFKKPRLPQTAKRVLMSARK
mmetsp:Transcript_10570/g.20351  ORF Transcript_10570/g.20351 Transcript_10570/m.20351 type:complete len:926 (+) Transcript_10570:1351-4128(+)